MDYVTWVDYLRHYIYSFLLCLLVVSIVLLLSYTFPTLLLQSWFKLQQRFKQFFALKFLLFLYFFLLLKAKIIPVKHGKKCNYTLFDVFTNKITRDIAFISCSLERILWPWNSVVQGHKDVPKWSKWFNDVYSFCSNILPLVLQLANGGHGSMCLILNLFIVVISSSS